jgi:hypothetical protein
MNTLNVFFIFQTFLLYTYARESGEKMQQKLQKAYGSLFLAIDLVSRSS